MFTLTVTACVLMAAAHQAPVCTDPITPDGTPRFVLMADCERYSNATYGTIGSEPIMFVRNGEVVRRVACAART